MIEKLYNIAPLYRELADRLCELETGGIKTSEEAQAVKNTLESVTGELEEKVENITYLIKEAQLRIENRKKLVLEMQCSITTDKALVANLSQYLISQLKIAGVKKMDAGVYRVGVVKNGGKLPINWRFTDIAEIPERFLKEKVVREVNNEKVREALDAGE